MFNDKYFEGTIYRKSGITFAVMYLFKGVIITIYTNIILSVVCLDMKCGLLH